MNNEWLNELGTGNWKQVASPEASYQMM